MEQDSGQHTSDVWGWVQDQLSLRKERPTLLQQHASSAQAHLAADVAARAWNIQGFNLENDLAKFLDRRI
eukprot:10738571-Heterocapsa_arctica.AAC.1